MGNSGEYVLVVETCVEGDDNALYFTDDEASDIGVRN